MGHMHEMEPLIVGKSPQEQEEIVGEMVEATDPTNMDPHLAQESLLASNPEARELVEGEEGKLLENMTKEDIDRAVAIPLEKSPLAVAGEKEIDEAVDALEERV